MTKRRARELPECRGKLTRGRDLKDLTWLRVGGAAEWFFQPADRDDLRDFLAQLHPDIPIFTMGVGSNLIVRDGGIPGVVVRLGRAFSSITIDDGLIRCGAAVPVSRVARTAAKSGYDLSFLRTIPGTVGGAAKMNAGCYGSYLKDCCHKIHYVTRQGQWREITAEEAGFGYRSSQIPDNSVIIETILVGGSVCDPKTLEEKMVWQLQARDLSQPSNMRTAGSTFRNPSGFSSTGRGDDTHELKAWKLIDDAGMRGHRIGGAGVSELHPNFLVNFGDATAAEIEELGERVRRKVYETSGIELEWEIIRVGNTVLPPPKDIKRGNVDSEAGGLKCRAK